MGNLQVLDIVAAALEDESGCTRRAAYKTLSLSLFGRGSYVSERKHKILVNVQAGMSRWQAAEQAYQEVSTRRGGIDADLEVIEWMFIETETDGPWRPKIKQGLTSGQTDTGDPSAGQTELRRKPSHSQGSCHGSWGCIAASAVSW